MEHPDQFRLSILERLQSQQLEEAESLAKEAATLFPAQTEFIGLLALVYHRQARWLEALESIRRIGSKEQHTQETLSISSLIHADLGQYATSEKHHELSTLQKGLKTSSFLNSKFGYLEIFKTLLQKNRRDQALEILKNGFWDIHGDPDLDLKLGMLFIEINDLSTARSCFQNGLNFLKNTKSTTKDLLQLFLDFVNQWTQQEKNSAVEISENPSAFNNYQKWQQHVFALAKSVVQNA